MNFFTRQRSLSGLLISLVLFFAVGALFMYLTQANDQAALDETYLAFERDEKVYKEYSTFMSEIENRDDPTPVMAEFNSKITRWRTQLTASQETYKKHSNSKDSQVAQMSKTGEQAVQKALTALGKYEEGNKLIPQFVQNPNKSEPEKEKIYIEFVTLMNDGDKLLRDSAVEHDQAADIYNQEKDKPALNLRNVLIVFTTLAVGLSSFLYTKSKQAIPLELKSHKLKVEAYRDLFRHSLWLSGGMLLTTAGLSYAIQKGGNYFIFYGPVLFGGYDLARGLYQYLTTARPEILKLQRDELDGKMVE